MTVWQIISFLYEYRGLVDGYASVALLEYIVKEPTSDIKQTPNDPWNDWVTNDVVTDYLAGKLLDCLVVTYISWRHFRSNLATQKF